MGKEKRLCFSLHVIRCNLEEITLSCPLLKNNIYRIKHYILFKFADIVCNHNKLKTYLLKCNPHCFRKLSE